jgi:hypothetical protein
MNWHIKTLGGTAAVAVVTMLSGGVLPGTVTSAHAQSQDSPVASRPAGSPLDVGWPRIFGKDNYTISIYQPQVESWDGTTMKLTAAVSVHEKDAKEAQFGVLKVAASVFIDKVERTVHFTSINVEKTDFPALPADKKDAYVGVLTPIVTDLVKSISLDRIEAQLADLKFEQQAKAVPIQNPVPAFVFATKPTLLVTLQGDPVLQPAGEGVQRVVNTQVFLAKTADGAFYLHLWDGYLTAQSLSGDWAKADSAPTAVDAAKDAAVKAKLVDLLGGRPDPSSNKAPSLKTDAPPAVVVATVPTELVSFEGQANWVPLSGTNLLYVSNTPANVFMDMDDQQTYVLASGRWFKAASLGGPWSYVAPKELPTEFAKIPVTSSKENVLASVPGTAQAKQALIAAQIPQMAKVSRKAAKLPELKFDGTPQIKPIEGTGLKYVMNCTFPVIETAGGTWYALYGGVWFVAQDMGGPWTVADSVAAEIYGIPASSPLHYVVYAKIYGLDADTVLVGYTPGYYGAVVASDGVVVYGTGYAYPPYVSSTTYIPAPVTYGYNATMAWTPWTGWAFGFAAGWATAQPYSYWSTPPPVPYWGPYASWSSGYYHNGYGGYTAYGPGGWAGTTGNMYSHWGNWSAESTAAAGYNRYTGNAGAYQYGHAYNSVTGTMAAGQRNAEANVYTGNYSYGKSGVAYNPYSGKSAAGWTQTYGNAYTGRQVTAGQAAVYNPHTGETNTAEGVHGEQGGIYNVNGNTFATHDGNIYRPSDQGGYDHYSNSGSWDHVQDNDLNRSLSSSYSSQMQGEQRFNSWQNHGYQDNRSSFGDGSASRSWGGGGWGSRDSWGGSRSYGGGGGWGGGGRSFGGGGGFHGFRR